MSINGKVLATGYAGKAATKNDSTKENAAYSGPIPRCKYKMGAAYKHTILGSVVMNLDPIGHSAPGNTLFRIHGDNATGTASEDGITMPRFDRDQVLKHCYFSSRFQTKE